MEEYKHLLPKFSYSLQNIASCFGYSAEPPDPSTLSNGPNTSSSQRMELYNIKESCDTNSRQEKGDHLSTQINIINSQSPIKIIKSNTPEPQHYPLYRAPKQKSKYHNKSSIIINQNEQPYYENTTQSRRNTNFKQTQGTRPAVPKIMYNYNVSLRSCKKQKNEAYNA